MRNSFVIKPRTAISLMAILSLNLLGAAKHVDKTQYILYVGAYGKGINAYRFDTSDGKLEALGQMGEVLNPSFLATDPRERFLYAVSEVQGKTDGGVAAFEINAHTGALKALNTRSSAGIAPCHLAVDKTGKMLMVANYTSGGVSSFPLEKDGSIGEMASLMTAEGHSVNPHRQEGPHAHEVVVSADNKIAYVPDLGLDELRLYRLDPSNATLSPNDPPSVKQDPGMGPRHMVFSHDESIAYVVNELKSEVSVFKHEKSTGAMTKIQDVSTLPEGYSGQNGPAEILIDAAGKYVYVTNRGAESIAVFAVNSGDGKLRQVQVISAEGKMPRGLALDPSGKYLFAGNQTTNNFVIFHVDADSGQLKPTGQVVTTPSPVDFQFIALK